LETQDEEAEEGGVAGPPCAVGQGGGAGGGGEAVAGDAGADEGFDCGESGGADGEDAVCGFGVRLVSFIVILFTGNRPPPG